jgi:hypothetical protein
MLNVVCVNQNNYLGRGDEYVSKLRDGIERNLTAHHRFHIIENVDGAEGWWAKLAMFQPGRFRGRCLYFDLDTIIVGSLDDLAGYDGDFAGISDFYHPDLLQSGVMAWEACKADHIWTKWHDAGRPQFHPRGDGGWIGTMMPNAERLQDKFPGQLVSFKAHCSRGIPPNARAVCFHGLPRPHQIADLMAHW